MKKSILVLLLAVSACSVALAQSTLYPFPAKWSYQDIASWTLPRPKLVETLPPVGNARSGDLLFLENNPVPALCYNNGSAWSVVGATGSQSGGVGPFFQFMNVATVPFSIPVIGRMGSWTAERFPKVGSFGASLSGSQLYFCPSTGELGAVIASAGFVASMSTPYGAWPPQYTENESAMFDGNYDTYATIWYDPSWGSNGYPQVGPYYRWATASCTRVAMMFSGDFSVLPTSIVARRWDGSVWTTLWTGSGASAGVKQWYVSASFPMDLNWDGVSVRFTPSSTVATSPYGTRWRRVEVAEIRFLQQASEPTQIFGMDACPKILPLLHPDPASATFDGFVVRGQTATPTARVVGTLWVDTNLSPPRIKFWNGSSWTSM